jgi:N-acetylglucosamine-6-phosphate deacetylase
VSEEANLVITGGQLVTPDGVAGDLALVVAGDRIARLQPAGDPVPRQARVIDATGELVAPGFIDVHVHGGAGHDTMDATPEALDGLSRHLARHGVTSFLATTVTAPGTAIDRAIDTVAAARAGVTGARLLGVHLEGPYLSPDHRGAQPIEHLRPPDPAEYGRWFDSGVVTRITVAPELPGARELIATACRRGIAVAAGHCGASLEEMADAADLGLAHVCHTFNGMAPLHHREPGAVGATLTDDRLYAELIADAVHVHPTAMAVLIRCKGPQRTVLVSDATRATGLPDGTYTLGGQTITVTQGVPRTPAGGLAGSTLTLDRAVAHLVALVGVPLHDAITTATATPAATVGAGDLGALAPGRRADLVVLDGDLRVRATIVGGRSVYDRQEDQHG